MSLSRGRLAVGAVAVMLLACPMLAQGTGVHPISGRRIAPVMGYQGADWLDRNEREDEERHR